jgi:hypothetical protein
VVDFLGIEKSSVLSASAGGPYAFVCARFLPKERLKSTTVVCGIGSVDALCDTVPYLSWRCWGFVP